MCAVRRDGAIKREGKGILNEGNYSGGRLGYQAVSVDKGGLEADHADL